MAAAAQILWDVIHYRLRKLEMANLAGAVSIAVALGLSLSEVAYRTLFAFVLNVFVYLNNDYVDLHFDLDSPDKDQDKTRFLQHNRGAAIALQWALVALLVALAMPFPRDLLAALVLGGGVCVAYSGWLKRRPYVDIVAMMAWGVAMPLCGTPLDRTLGVLMAGQLGLISGVFESIQVMRDESEDREQGVQTTAVVLGAQRTLLLARVLMVLAAVYAALVLHPLSGALGLAAVAIPMGADPARYWTRVKLCFGLSWLVGCAQVYWMEASAGLWLRLPAQAAL